MAGLTGDYKGNRGFASCLANQWASFDGKSYIEDLLIGRSFLTYIISVMGVLVGARRLKQV